jgi:hypothetical protein
MPTAGKVVVVVCDVVPLVAAAAAAVVMRVLRWYEYGGYVSAVSSDA